MNGLVAFDMEGCLTDDPTVWEIMHRKWGTWESHGAPYWERYQAGDFEYDDFARLDVGAWKGAPRDMLKEAVREVPLMPGCRELMDELAERGVYLALITNGLACLAHRCREELGFDRVYANVADTDGPRLSGRLALQVPFEAKGQVLRDLMVELDVEPHEVAAVGDGRADAAMFQVAGTGVAFCPSHPQPARHATEVVEARDLRRLIPLLCS